MELAEKLCLGEYNEEGLTLEDIKNVEDFLGTWVKVVRVENLNIVIYRDSTNRDITIMFYNQGNRYDLITNMNPFYEAVYYCEKCDKPYDHRKKHKCKPIEETVCVSCVRR